MSKALLLIPELCDHADQINNKDVKVPTLLYHKTNGTVVYRGEILVRLTYANNEITNCILDALTAHYRNIL